LSIILAGSKKKPQAVAACDFLSSGKSGSVERRQARGKITIIAEIIAPTVVLLNHFSTFSILKVSKYRQEAVVSRGKVPNGLVFG
jgi:hypothetical protein